MARLWFVEEKGGLPLVQAQARDHVDPQLLVPREEDADRREELVEDQRLGDMEACGERLRPGSPSRALPSAAGHLDDVLRELELASPAASFPGDRDPAGHQLARVRPQAVVLPPAGASQEDIGSAQGLIAADEVVRPGVFMTEVLVDPQEEILRGLIETPGRVSSTPGISGPQDLLDRREDRVLPVAVPEGARRGASNRLLPDGERFEVVDRRPQISRGPLDDPLDDVRGG